MSRALRLLGLSASSARKVGTALYRVPLGDTARAILQRTIFDVVFEPGWTTRPGTVVLTIHKLAQDTPESIRPFVLRAKLQHRLARTLHTLATPLAYTVSRGAAGGSVYFVYVTRDHAPLSKPSKRSVSPVTLAGIEYTIAHLWGEGFSFSKITPTTFFTDPKTSLPIVYDLDTLTNGPWPRWKKQELARLKKNLPALEKMYLSSQNTADAVYLSVLRKRFTAIDDLRDLQQARALM